MNNTYNNNDYMQDEKSTKPYLMMYAPGYSNLSFCFYKEYLTLNFMPYVGTEKNGKDNYDFQGHLSTSINFKGAAALFFLMKAIIMGEENAMEMNLPQHSNTILRFEYRAEEQQQMAAYLTIIKNKREIVFKFAQSEYYVYNRGHKEKKILHTGLYQFVKGLSCYINAPTTDSNLCDVLDDQFAYQHYGTR